MFRIKCPLCSYESEHENDISRKFFAYVCDSCQKCHYYFDDGKWLIEWEFVAKMGELMVTLPSFENLRNEANKDLNLKERMTTEFDPARKLDSQLKDLFKSSK